MKTFRDLIVWKKSKDLVVEIYKITNIFPKSESYSLVDQLRRASISVPSNIAEGCQRRSTKEFSQFLYIAYGSCAEIQTQLDIAKDLHYLDSGEYKILLDKVQEIEKMTVMLIRSLDKRKERFS